MTYVVPATQWHIRSREDARREDDRLARTVVGGVGLVPLALLALSAFGVFGLRDLATHVLPPALAAAVVVLRRDRLGPRMVLEAVAIGMVATAAYDLFRFAFLAGGLLPSDPIPHIGAALRLHPDWLYGYAWRYVGDGGGLAVAFLALGLRGVRAGVAFGLMVAAGLLLTLALSPLGQQMLFPLTATTVVMAVGGHAIYGAVLGSLAGRRPVQSY